MRDSTMRTPIVIVLCAFGLLASKSAAGQVLLPNLEPFPASDVQLVDGGNTLRFSTTSWNRGVVPLELMGGDVTPDGTQREVYQRIFQADGSSYITYVGAFEYHGGTHSHFHLEGYARYRLQPVSAVGATERTSDKVSFCLLDNLKVNTHLPGAPKKPVYQECNPYVQGISVGWGDIYGYYLDGQSIDFTANPSGDYLLTIEVNPDGTLYESNYSDNIACALIRVNVGLQSVQVLDTTCNPMYGTVAVDSISPNMMGQGSQETVTVTGSGFGDGIDVFFDGGSGKPPVASNVVVVDANTIQATVTVPKGGSQADPVWDLHVGPATLPDALTVVR